MQGLVCGGSGLGSHGNHGEGSRDPQLPMLPCPPTPVCCLPVSVFILHLVIKQSAFLSDYSQFSWAKVLDLALCLLVRMSPSAHTDCLETPGFAASSSKVPSDACSCLAQPG